MGAIFQNTRVKKIPEKDEIVENVDKIYEKCSNCDLSKREAHCMQ